MNSKTFHSYMVSWSGIETDTELNQKLYKGLKVTDSTSIF